MENQPNTPIPAPAASCGLATASLVCGICALFLGPLAGIPAIVTGHMALGRIRKSGGLLQGGGAATAGLIMGYVFTAISLLVFVLAAAGFAAGNAAMNKARSVSALSMAMQIESAVESYYTEYATMPSNGTSDVTVQTDEDTGMLAILLGTDPGMNPKSIRFLSVQEAKGLKNGILYGAGGTSAIGLYDPWGGGFKVRLDLDYDEKVLVNPGSGETLAGKRVAVWSDGPDRKPGTEDDVKTW